MRAASFVLKIVSITTSVIFAQPEIQMLHRAWADQLNGIPHSAIIDIGAYLTLGRNRSVATLKAQHLLVNLHKAFSAARHGIALGRIDPGKQHSSYTHIAQWGHDFAQAYEELFLCDRAYTAAHTALIDHLEKGRLVAQAVKNADDIVRAAVMQAIATESPSVAQKALVKIGTIAEFIGALIGGGPSKRFFSIDLFRQILLSSYREFTVRYNTIGEGLWGASLSHEETTLELWRIIENARIRTYEALCAALCEKYIDAGACND